MIISRNGIGIEEVTMTDGGYCYNVHHSTKTGYKVTIACIDYEQAEKLTEILREVTFIDVI